MTRTPTAHGEVVRERFDPFRPGPIEERHAAAATAAGSSGGAHERGALVRRQSRRRVATALTPPCRRVTVQQTRIMVDRELP